MNGVDPSAKLTVLGKICLAVLVTAVLALAAAWIAATGHPNPHGPFDPSEPLPWTAVCLNISASVCTVVFFLSLILSIAILIRRRRPPRQRDRKIAKWTLLMSLILFSHAIILPPVLCYRSVKSVDLLTS